MKRLIALILCIVMCIPLFVACDSDEPEDKSKDDAASESSTASTTTGSVETGSVSTDDETSKKTEYQDIAKNDWGGFQFKVYYMDDYTGGVSKDFVCDTPNGDILNDQVYQRNTMVENDYNIDIFVETYSDVLIMKLCFKHIIRPDGQKVTTIWSSDMEEERFRSVLRAIWQTLHHTMR